MPKLSIYYLNPKQPYTLNPQIARRSGAGVDVVPTFTTSNERMCLLLADGTMGMLRIEDAERLQVEASVRLPASCPSVRPAICPSVHQSIQTVCLAG
jgi:hypothetical protein